MKSIRIIIVSFILLPIAHSAEIKGRSYSFNVPDDVELKGRKEKDFYFFALGEDSPFMFYPNSVISDAETLDSTCDKAIRKIEEGCKTYNGFKSVTTDSKAVHFGHFNGRETVVTTQFYTQETMYSYSVHLWDGVRGWTGVLGTANTNDIHKARSILKSEKRKSTCYDQHFTNELVGKWKGEDDVYLVTWFDSNGGFQEQTYKSKQKKELLSTAHGNWWVKNGHLHYRITETIPSQTQLDTDLHVFRIENFNATEMTLVGARSKMKQTKYRIKE